MPRHVPSTENLVPEHCLYKLARKPHHNCDRCRVQERVRRSDRNSLSVGRIACPLGRLARRFPTLCNQDQDTTTTRVTRDKKNEYGRVAVLARLGRGVQDFPVPLGVKKTLPRGGFQPLSK